MIQQPNHLLLNGTAHCLPLSDETIQTIMTSPPYFAAVRRYEGQQLTDWPEIHYAPMTGLPSITVPAMSCALGHEPYPAAYVAHLVHCAREWWRVLRSDGTLWLNLGDVYAGNRGRQVAETKYRDVGNNAGMKASNFKLKPKDLAGIPWRVALALQADGWWLRVDAPWIKRNAKPGSQTDRPTVGHEYVFFLSKSRHYYYDNEAVKLPLTESSIQRQKRANRAKAKYGRPISAENKMLANGKVDQALGQAGLASGRSNGCDLLSKKRTRRTTDWWFESLDRLIAQQTGFLGHLESVRADSGPVVDEAGHIQALQVNLNGYKGQHFAAYPNDLVRPCIQASTSERGRCPHCGAPWQRIVEKVVGQSKDCPKTQAAHEARGGNGRLKGTVGKSGGGRRDNLSRTVGWQPACNCPPAEAVPCLVLDPFCGTGTTLVVARELGQFGIGVDISHHYLVHDAAKRLAVKPKPETAVSPPPIHELPLFATAVNGSR